VLSRTGGLILAGVLYIRLILGLSWWWGILQAIGVAYFMGAASMKLSLRGRWAAVFGVLAFHIFMSHYTSWWLHFGATDQPFWTVGRIYGSWAKPLIIHCRPWVSISYGAMTMIGVLLGSALVTRERAAITRQCLLLGGVFGSLGYLLHAYGLSSGHIGLCFNKPDVTASYAMFASGVGALVFLGLYYLVDIMGVKRWASPLKVFGANALLAYFMQIVMRLFFRALQIEPLFAGEPNQTVKDWASLFTSPRWSALFLDKSGYHGVFWGLLWTFCLWLIIRQCNKRGLYWKL
jgi:predicted acyltransferase